MTSSSPRLLIVGNSTIFHIGAHLYRAARDLAFEVKLCDTNTIGDVSWLVRQFNWRLRGHRPPGLQAFSQLVVEACQAFKPDVLLATGTTPLTAHSLEAIKMNGIKCLNYLTDDPWNPGIKARWLFEALPQYDMIFSPRRANLDDLRRIGCQAEYLPFGYDPITHFPEAPPPERRAEFECDVLFYGGADRDRVPYIEALVRHGVNVHLYGGYWNRYPKLRPMYRGHADPQTLRWAVAGAKVTLCLVRRANRDGHVMRTFEVPAMRGCMLVEDTVEHREIFGPDGEAVAYFKHSDDMLERASCLLRDEETRRSLAANAHGRICSKQNTYADRLRSMLNYAKTHPALL